MPRVHAYICERYPTYYINSMSFDDYSNGVEIELTDEELAEIRNAELHYKDTQMIIAIKMREAQKDRK